ncbi:hypothetical protein ACRALDRAFT_1076753 [Sodiomyces alcalophilus JCM 7366]|uniref:uncharacterized protein n=1 Tax=Sodiomyces alcalophilus JCM 7366 TaxID=591952 RepID=UPI0039B4C678
MSSNNPPIPISPSLLTSSAGLRSRRTSVNSISTVDKEQLNQTLDKIHSSSAQTDSLTTFKDLSPPPPGSLPANESKSLAGDLVQGGLSGLYNRFKEAVGVSAPSKAQEAQDDGGHGHTHVQTLAPSSAEPEDCTAAASDSPNQTHPPQSSRASTSTASALTVSHAGASGRQSLPAAPPKAPPTVAVTSDVTPPVMHRNSIQSLPRSEDASSRRSSIRESIGTNDPRCAVAASGDSMHEPRDPDLLSDRRLSASQTRRGDGGSAHAGADTPLSPTKDRASSLPHLQTDLGQHHARTPSVVSGSSSLLPGRHPAATDRIGRSRSPAYPHSRHSSTDRDTADASPIDASSQNSMYHDPSLYDPQFHQMRSGTMSIPDTIEDGRVPEESNSNLEELRKKILSKEFWMADETCKECFSCGQPFTTFRRKHHCRVCGFIFDSKCTSIIPAQMFGMSGTLRLCKPCLKVIDQRSEDISSDDSEDESFLPAIFRPNQPKQAPPKVTEANARGEETSFAGRMEDLDDARSISTPMATPMMAIPATRRIDESNRRSAILEIDAPELSRPGSSRSLRSMTTTTGRPHSAGPGHRRHHSKHNFWSKFKPNPDDSAPFRKDINEEMAMKPRYTAFHDDNIIDPDLAAYMSDESSGDEQMSISATMATSDLQPSSFDRDKSNFGPFTGGARKLRLRGMDEVAPPGSALAHARPSRRRNLSNVSGNIHHLRSPRPRSGVFKGFSISSDGTFHPDGSGAVEATKLTRSDSMLANKEPQIELNSSSMQHVKKLLHQLLEDSKIPNAHAWEKALAPILLRCTDDVVPDIRAGDDMDIRHYVKLKKIPGGRPGDTSYVSGVIFTKNLALKSMPRRIVDPRIVLVSFPIEYQRHQQQFMSLQPVIEQEKEFLRVVVNRIINLRPQVLLCEKSVSGVALQYLSEANIAVAYNVKPSVLSAVSRCAEADIITSLDRLALRTQVGRAGGFEVKTFVNKNYPGNKKTYIFLSGCSERLGCTIALRGDSTEVLARMKRITEFMVYVVYNLKLETCLMRDEFTRLPSEEELAEASTKSATAASSSAEPSQTGASNSQPSLSELEPPSQTSLDVPQSDGAASGGHPSEPSEDGAVAEPPSKATSLNASQTSGVSAETPVPEDVPMPTYYSDMVARYQTKILSASPFVKFAPPYLLMKAREQERKLVYFKRLRDQVVVEEQADPEKKPQRFQLIKPKMVHTIGQKAPRQIMEVLHAVHDAEYDKALHTYQTQTRHWENYIQGNIDLFDPYSHQNIVVLYSVICTETKIPCAEPGLIAISFYDEHVDAYGSMDPDCTLGQYIEDLCLGKDLICLGNGCDRTMMEHHRTYVHDEARITVFVEPAAVTSKHITEDITMWTYCKMCKKDSPTMPMSDSTWKYSFGKYLELLFWCKGLRLHESTGCTHDHREHIRFFQLRDTWIRIHYDPIDLLEIIVPRARITWKVDHDLELKNKIFNNIEDRWVRFMTSVKLRLKSIRIDSVLPEKTDACMAEIEMLTKKAQDDQVSLIRQLQDTYVNSKYYEVIPFNATVREMLEKAGEWDAAFTQFEADFLPDKDIRQLTMLQLKKLFTDNESKDSLPTTEGSTSTIDTGEPPSQTFSEMDEKMTTQPTDLTNTSLGESTPSNKSDETGEAKGDDEVEKTPAESTLERVEPLDLATSRSPPKEDPSPLVPSVGVEVVGDEPGQVKQDAAVETASADSQGVALAAPISRPTTEDAASVVAGEMSLSERIEQLRRQHLLEGGKESTAPVPIPAQPPPPPRPAPEMPSSTVRRSGLTVSPPMVRASSHPVRTLQKPKPGIDKSMATRSFKPVREGNGEPGPAVEGAVRVDKRLSERLGLGGGKGHRKAAPPSSIPRLVQKKKESRVSAIAKHFEQLSREFEKERMREDRKKRAARQTRAFLPRTSTNAIVEVYDDVNSAVQEAGPSDDEPATGGVASRGTGADDKYGPSPEPPSTVQTAPVTPAPASQPQSPEDSAAAEQKQGETTEEGVQTQTGPPETDEADAVNARQEIMSDNEGGASDHDDILEDILPDVGELTDDLEPSEDMTGDLAKHQKRSLMKFLSNFWAERSASCWPLLDYPVNPGDHIFIDSDVIVREDEPSSVIAFALNSSDYQSKLAEIRRQWQITIQKNLEANHGTSDTKSSGGSDTGTGGEPVVDEAELEKSLLRSTGTHLKCQFKEGSATMLCKIFFAEQFDALRRKCGVAERIIESLSRCLKWDSKGGKTKSVFLKTLDDRLVLKALSPVETSAFVRFAPAYFGIMAEALFHDLPSVIAKMLGFFQLIIKNPATGVEMKLDLLLMENLFYDRSPSRIFDLKGSMRNRKIQSTGEQNEVLLDENMVEFIYESPLFAREHSKKLLRASVWNDTLFLARQNVMDYSLMVAVDEGRKELVVGIIDCIRTYTWDKKLESWIKDRGFAGGGRNRPTVTSPKEYKSRFREAMARYILQSPNCWHQFPSLHMASTSQAQLDEE